MTMLELNNFKNIKSMEITLFLEEGEVIICTSFKIIYRVLQGEGNNTSLPTINCKSHFELHLAKVHSQLHFCIFKFW